jgi:hypothetical protein
LRHLAGAERSRDNAALFGMARRVHRDEVWKFRSGNAFGNRDIAGFRRKSGRIKLDLLDKGIKELERKLQITSTDGKQEKEIIKEMQFIKESRTYLEEVTQLNQIIYLKKKEKYEVSQPIGPLKEEAKELQTKIDSFKKTQE